MKFQDKGEGKLSYGNFELINFVIAVIMFTIALIIYAYAELFYEIFHSYLFSAAFILAGLYVALKTNALKIKAKKYKNKIMIFKISKTSFLIKKLSIREVSAVKVNINIKKGTIIYTAFFNTTSDTLKLFFVTKKITEKDVLNLKLGKNVEHPDSITDLEKFAKKLNITFKLPAINKSTLYSSKL